MAVADADVLTSLPQRVPQRVASGRHNRPSLDPLQETREARDIYLNQCVPLREYALKGNWKEAKHILDSNRMLINAAITEGWRTVLYVAAGENHVHFVEELLKLMSDDDLELEDMNGDNAFCFAAASGNMEIVKLLLRRNQRLPTIRGVLGMTPLQLAALQGRSKMANFLYDRTIEIFEDRDWNEVFFTCINTGIYDLAFKMLERRHELALERDENRKTALHILAQVPSKFGCQILEQQNEHTMKNFGEKQICVVQLVNSLWSKILEEKNSKVELMEIINNPSQVLFDATKVGNYQFVAALMRAYPDLIWEMDDRNRSIIHIAVLHRHADIFNLIHEFGSDKNIIATYVDSEDNNLLHLAAKLAPTNQFNLASSKAFQMSLELLWFEEVKKIMQPAFMKMKNAEGITPHELFIREHETLQKEAKDWMRKTANSYMLVSAMIISGVLATTFSTYVGTNDDTGNPNYLNKFAFEIFTILKSIALISSSTSALIFISIIISHYSNYDFYKSLPLKLIFGLIALFISIISMMITFSASFFIKYYHGLELVPGFIAMLAILPKVQDAYLQFKDCMDFLYSTWQSRSLFKPSTDKLY